MGNSSETEELDEVFTEKVRKRTVAMRAHSTRIAARPAEFQRNIIRSESVTTERPSSDSSKVYKTGDFKNEQVLGEGFFASATKVKVVQVKLKVKPI